MFDKMTNEKTCNQGEWMRAALPFPDPYFLFWLRPSRQGSTINGFAALDCFMY